MYNFVFYDWDSSEIVDLFVFHCPVPVSLNLSVYYLEIYLTNINLCNWRSYENTLTNLDKWVGVYFINKKYTSVFINSYFVILWYVAIYSLSWRMFMTS